MNTGRKEGVPVLVFEMVLQLTGRGVGVECVSAERAAYAVCEAAGSCNDSWCWSKVHHFSRRVEKGSLLRTLGMRILTKEW